MDVPLDTDLPYADEEIEVLRRRYHEAVDAGLSVHEARIFARNGEDVGVLRRLIADGCPVTLIALIVV